MAVCECKVRRRGIFLATEWTNRRDCGRVVHEQRLSLRRGGNEALAASSSMHDRLPQRLVTAVHHQYRCSAYSCYLALGVRESEAKPIGSIMEQQFPTSRPLYERGSNQPDEGECPIWAARRAR